MRQSLNGQFLVIESKIFKTMPKSLQTFTRVSEMADFIQTGNLAMICSSLCWGIKTDKSTDKCDFAQAIIYFIYADMESWCIITRFLTILRKVAQMLITYYTKLKIKAFIEAHNLPKQKVESFASDETSVLRSEGRGVSGHLRRNYNESIFTIVLGLKNCQAVCIRW